MKLNPKITGGLAWAGLIVILAVPGADMLTKEPAGAANRVAADIDPIHTADITADAVDSYLSSGKKLPSYISDAPTDTAAAKPAATVRLVAPATPAPTTAVTAPVVKPVTVPAPVVEVANVSPAKPAVAAKPMLVAPVPYPVSMRPRAPAAAPATNVARVEEAPLIVDEEAVRRRDRAVSAVLDEAPRSNARVVTSDQLEEWDSGSLADYLERRGLMSEGEAQAMNQRGSGAEGFWLDEGPSDGRRVIRRLPRRDSDFFLF
jgi:hypothetical protein